MAYKMTDIEFKAWILGETLKDVLVAAKMYRDGLIPNHQFESNMRLAEFTYNDHCTHETLGAWITERKDVLSDKAIKWNDLED